MANWQLTGDVVTQPTTIVSPNRTLQSVEMVRGVTPSYISLPEITNVVVQTPYTAIVYVKRQMGRFACLRVGGGVVSNNAESCYDLETATTSRTAVNGNVQMVDSFIHSIGDDWFVIGMTLEFLEETNANIYLSIVEDEASTILSTTSEQLSLAIWNPVFEKRDNVEESYLGSLVSSISVPDNGFAIIPIFRQNTTSVQYKDLNGSDVSIDINPAENFRTTSSLTYISIPQQQSHGFPDSFIVNDNKGGSREIKINREISFDRYSQAKVVFLNKRGALESFFMIRKRVFSQDTRSDMYYRNVINYRDFSYDPHMHVQQKYNVVSKESIEMNTSLLTEEQNTIIRELLQSEYVWVTIDGETIPVILKTSSVSYKTHNNDKLIQYEFTFDYANRLDNTIR